MFNNRSRILFTSSIIATAYIIYLIVYFYNGMQSNDSAEAIGGAIATVLVTPHILMIGLGTIFGWLGFFLRKSGFALVSAILFSVGALIFLMYAPICIPIIVLGFIGYANQKKLNNSNI